MYNRGKIIPVTPNYSLMSPTIHILCNSLANQGSAAAAVSQIRSALAGYPDITWHETTHPRHAADLAVQAAHLGAERLIIAGGDGTIHETVNGLMSLPASQRPLVGILPIGSGNDFAASLQIPLQLDLALQVALGNSIRSIDIGSLSDDQGRCEYWSNTMGIGFDAVTIIHSKNIHLLKGFPMYFYAVMKTIFFNRTPMQARMELDGKEKDIHILFLCLCNGRQEGGGFLIAPHAQQDDGYFDLLAVKIISRLRMLATLPHIIKGTHGNLDYTLHERFQRMQFTSDAPLIIQTDGEVYTGFDSKVHQVTIQAIPQAIQFLVPAAHR